MLPVPLPSSKYSQFPFSFLARDGKEQPLDRYTFVSKLWTSGKSDGKKEKANSGAVKFRDARNPLGGSLVRDYESSRESLQEPNRTKLRKRAPVLTWS